MKKQMLSRLEFLLILSGHLQKPYDHVFSAESLVIRSAVTNATPGFPQGELMVTSMSFLVAVVDSFLFSSESIFK